MHAAIVVVRLPATQPVAGREPVQDVGELARVAQVLALARLHIAVEPFHALLRDDGGVVDEASPRTEGAHRDTPGVLRAQRSQTAAAARR